MNRNVAVASITAAVAPCTPYTMAFGPLRRSTMMASPTGMMLAASMNPPSRRGSPAASTTKTTRPEAMSRTPQVVVPQWADQPYWASRVADLGIGAAHDLQAPTTESLSAALG